MNISEFQNLDREGQLEEAGRIAGIEPSVFDGIHRTESGRGLHMLSPKGAKGHFGLMDGTRSVWEKRFGATIDPHDFGQSLFTAAHTMKENMGRFKNVPDALRAYNGGWTPATWGNPETAAYAGKVLGTEDADDYTAPAVVAGGRPITPAADLWDRPAGGVPAKVGKPSAVAGAATAAVLGLSTGAVRAPTFGISNEAGAAVVAAQDAEQKLKDDTGFIDAARAAANGSLLNQGLRLAFRDPEPIDPNFAVPEDRLKDRTEGQQKQLRAAGSSKEFERLMFEQDDAKEQNEIVFRRGLLFGLGASIVSDLPSAAFTGGATALSFRAGGVGAFALAAQGRKAAALASLAGEGIVGEVAYTALLDAMDVHQGGSDYAMAVAGGVATVALGGKALGRRADKAQELQVANDIIQNAKLKQFKLAEQADKNLGKGATPEALAVEMKRIEAEGVRADLTSHKAAVPESRKFNVGEELDEAPPAASSERMPEGWGSVGEKPALSQFDDVNAARDELGERVADRWENPEFQQQRIQIAERAPAFHKMVEDFTDGNYTWDQVKELPDGIHRSSKLDALVEANPDFGRTVSSLESLVKEYLPNSRIVLGTGAPSGANGAVVSVGRTHVISLKDSANPDQLFHTAAHELGHAIYHHHAPSAPPELLARIDEEWLTFVNRVRSGEAGAWADRFAPTSGAKDNLARLDNESAYHLSRDEFMAEQFVKHLQNRLLSGAHGKLPAPVLKQVMDGVKAVMRYILDLMKMGKLAPGEAVDEFFGNVLKGIRERRVAIEATMPEGAKAPTLEDFASLDKGHDKTAKDVTDMMANPIAVKYGLDMLPMGSTAERAEAKQIIAVYTRADAWAAANPVDEKRLNLILSRFDSLDPTSNQMLRSENPVVRMVASELLENGGGAAGRRSSAAIAKHMNERAIIGNVINDLDTSFKAWHKGQPGADQMGEFFTGKKRIEFNRLIAEEIEQRRYPNQQTDFGQAVRDGADAVEGSFERARLMQTDAKTVGWGALPSTSRGYMPHRMRSDVIRSLTNSQRRSVLGALTDQFIAIEGFDMSFADQLAAKYLDRVSQRALGGFDAPMGLHQTGAHDVVKEALEQMNMTRPEIDAVMKRYVAGGAQHTKKRLNLDLRQSFQNDDGTSFRLMDLFDTDMLNLVRGQSQRVSGEVALARHGVMGKPGLAILRRAMGVPGGRAQKRELDAFDQVSAEFLGAPFGVQNKWVDRAMQANSVMSLGGMGFNQLGEIINVGTTLGVKAALANVSGFGRLRSEILQKARGGVVNNPLLDSLEKFGGAEFGTDAYKMVFPMDLPDAPIHTMGADSVNAADRLLRGAGHLQTKLSGWRAISSVQQRGVAEQVVHSIAQAMRKGDSNVTLADMGVSQDVLNRLRADFGNIAKFNGNTLVEFDITKATDVDAANQLVQAVHRGVSQMIQGTFVGETGKYVHNSYLKLLTQFRTFSLTAVDKQWNRQAGNRGVGVALAMTVGAMSVAVPIYMTRTYLASIGRKDQEEYLEKHLHPFMIARATTNYIATSGLAGDFVDGFTSVFGLGELTGGRSGANTQLVGNLVAPALGKVDKVWGALQDTKDGTDVHGLLREMPLSRLPFFIPAINALGD